MFKKLAIGAASIGTVLAMTLPAAAWDFQVSGKGECDTTTGEYNITWTIVNPETENATVAASDRAAVAVGTTIDANDSRDYSETVPGNSTSVQLNVELDWPSDSQQPSKNASIRLAGDCEAPEEDKPTPQVSKPPEGGVDTGKGGTAN